MKRLHCLLLTACLLPPGLPARTDPPPADIAPVTTTPPAISTITGSARQQPLAIEQAFPFHVSELGGGRYRVSWNPAPEHYLYRHGFHFALREQATADSRPLDWSVPDGIRKNDPFFGPVEAYYGQVSADVRLDGAPDSGSVLVIEYQGCADWGFCYPPQQFLFELAP